MPGGFFKGRSFRADNDPPDVERAFAILWGRVVGDVDDNTTTTRSVHFVVKYHSHKSYMRCEAHGDNEATFVMGALEKGDMVLCLGEYWQHPKREGKRKKSRGPDTQTGAREMVYGMRCDVVVPMEAIVFILRLMAAKNIQQLLDEYESAPPDKHSWDDE